MAQKIAISNLKGGVGKTTTAANVAVIMGERFNKKVLLIDLDPQANSTTYLAQYDNAAASIEDVLLGDASIKSAIKSTKYTNVDLVPSKLSLAYAESKISSDMTKPRESRLSVAIAQVEKEYDFVLIDCPPSISILTMNGLLAADEVIIPIKIDGFAMEGLRTILATIDNVSTNFKNTELKSRVLITIFEGQTNLNKQFYEQLQKSNVARINTTVRKAIAVSESTAQSTPLLFYKNREKEGVTQDYIAVTEEIIKGV